MSTAVTTLVLLALFSAPALPQQAGCHLELDGIQDRVFVPNDPSLPSAVFSVTAWVRTDSAATEAIVTRGEDDLTDVLPWGFGVHQKRLYLQVEDAANFSASLYIGSAEVADGEWHHVAVTHDASNLGVLYVDGLPDASFTTVQPGTSSQDMGIGFSYQGSGSSGGTQPALLFFEGRLDEITLWTAAIGAADVAEIMSQGLPSSPTGLLARWSFDSGVGQTAVDSVGSFDATLGSSGAPETADPAWSCHDATNYCTAGVSASGCQPAMSASGSPSAGAASGFFLGADGVEGNKPGLLFFGTSGRQANSWGTSSSYQCVVPPVKRGELLAASGTTGGCDGSFLYDLTARWTSKPAQNPGPGAVVQTQFWYRDPQNTSNKATSLTDAIEFTALP